MYKPNDVVLVQKSTCTIISSLYETKNVQIYKVKMQNSEYCLKSFLTNEIEILKQFKNLERIGGHPNIVEYIKSDNIKEQGLLVMELLLGKTLQDYIAVNMMKEDQIMQVVTCVSSAIAYLHALNPPLYHWNLNMDNIMLVQGEIAPNDFTCVKIIDFTYSTSTPISPSQLQSVEINKYKDYFRSLKWPTPQMINLNQDINETSDIHNIARLLHFLLFKSDPLSPYKYPSSPKYPPFFEILLSKLFESLPSASTTLHLCREYFIGALPVWITRKYLPENETPISNKPAPSNFNTSLSSYQVNRILDISNFNQLKNINLQLSLQYPAITVSSSNVVYTIPIDTPNVPASKHNVTASLALFNNPLLVTYNATLDVYNVEKKQRIQSKTLPIKVEFMDWLSSEVIVLITSEAIYHMNINDSVLEEMAGLLTTFKEIQYYDVDKVKSKWLLVSGDSIQLHSIDKNGSQMIPGEIARLKGNLLHLINKGQNHTYLHMVPVEGGDPTSVQIPLKEQVNQLIIEDYAYIASKSEFLIYSLKSKSIIYSTTLANALCKSCLFSGVFFGIDVSGSVLCIGQSSNSAMVKSTVDTTAERSIERSVERPVERPMERTISNKPSTAFTNTSTTSIALVFNDLLEKVSSGQSINKEDSVLFAKYGQQLGLQQLVISYIQQNKLQTSEQLGDELLDTNVKLLCYKNSNSYRKVVRLLAEQKDYNKLNAYLRTIDYQPEDQYIMDEMAYTDAETAIEYCSRHLNSNNRPTLVKHILEIMQRQGNLKEAIGFLSLVIEDTIEYSELQTIYLQLLFQFDQHDKSGNFKYSHFDKWVIALLCIEHGMYMVAIELYLDHSQLNPVYVELSVYLINQKKSLKWIECMDQLDMVFTNIINSIVNGHLLNTSDSGVIYALLEALLSKRKREWLLQITQELVESKGSCSSNMTIQTLYCLSVLITKEQDFTMTINQLHHYDHFVVSNVAQKMDHVEDSFRVLERFREYDLAALVLTKNVQDLARALEFADKVNKEKVWEIVGTGILEAMRKNTKLRLELRKTQI